MNKFIVDFIKKYSLLIFFFGLGGCSTQMTNNTSHKVTIEELLDKSNWSGSDYVSLATNLRSSSAASLPTLDDPREVGVFSKLISNAPLDYYRDLKIPINERISDFSQYWSGLSSVYKIYASAHTAHSRGVSYHHELIKLTILSLDSTVVGVDIVRNYQLARKEDGQIPFVRVPDTPQMYNGFLIIYDSALSILTAANDIYNPAEVSALINTLYNTAIETPEAFPDHYAKNASILIQSAMNRFAGSNRDTLLQLVAFFEAESGPRDRLI